MPQQKPRSRKGGSSRKNANRSQGATSDAIRYPIPEASAAAWEQHKNKTPQNPGLIFDRFAPDWSGQSTLKKDGLETVRQAAERVDNNLLRDWNARWEMAVRAVYAEPFFLKTDWRFIAGLGRKGALEVGFTFHRYGFPILPGSSVKGVARAWALIQIQIAEKVGQTDLKALDEKLNLDGEKDSRERREYEAWLNSLPEDTRRWVEDFRAIFGTTAAAGKVVFFDAIPANKPTLELDIMNPHYPKYYSGEEPPTDWQSPVPVYFLTVAPGTEFRFAVGWRGAPDEEGKRLQSLAVDWLKAGLQELGAGAKTGAGYGYFTSPPGAEAAADQLVTATAESRASQPAPAPQPAPPPLPEDLVWRSGTVREYRPDQGRGRLVDDETGEEFSFRREAIEERGWSPGRKHRVRYAVVEEEGHRRVVKIRRA